MSKDNFTRFAPWSLEYMHEHFTLDVDIPAYNICHIINAENAQLYYDFANSAIEIINSFDEKQRKKFSLRTKAAFDAMYNLKNISSNYIK